MILEKIKSGNGFTTLCKCDFCNSVFNKKWVLVVRAKNQFCCKSCHDKFQIGSKSSEETKIKVGLASKGRIHSKETKEKIRLSNIGKHSGENNGNFGKTFPLEKNSHWKGGRIYSADGYILLKKPDHPYADNQGYVKEHRLVMENILGRYLLPEEIVHHKNSIKDDNRPENLELYPNMKEHTKYHNLLRLSQCLD